MSNTNNQNEASIPLITDVVVPANSELKRKLLEKQQYTEDHGAVNLQRRIDDVESAIGQDESKAPSRAHAIRSELSAL